MPVFTRMRDGVLVLTVDGDFTANEIRRVAFRAMEDPETPAKAGVLLDMSGAAGASQKSSEEMQATGAIFAAYRDRITGVAVVAAADAHALFAEGGDFARESDLPLKACHAHSEARDWLATVPG